MLTTIFFGQSLIRAVQAETRHERRKGKLQRVTTQLRLMSFCSDATLCLLEKKTSGNKSRFKQLIEMVDLLAK